MWHRHLFIRALVCLASQWVADGGTTAQDCYTFYAGDLRTGPSCPASCPYRTQCKSDTQRFSCTQDGDCIYLLSRGDQVNMMWTSHANDSLRSSAQVCVPCTINGCIDCKSGLNGELKCSKCNPSFYLDSEGTCTWKSTAFDAVVYTCIAVVMIFSVWLLIDLIRAECAPIKNGTALDRGLKMRRRAQLFRLTDKTGNARSVGSGTECSDTDGNEHSQLKRYPLNTGLHWYDSHHIMGPGLPLFMNWFPFMILLGLWFCFGALLYAPSYSEEETYVDPCKQQGRVKNGWVFRTDTPLRHGRDGNDVRWAIWNYVGATLITAIFLYLQQRMWSHMVVETTMPSLREYCVVLSGVPAHETDKGRIRHHLGNWMERLELNRSGIKEISIAYHIPSDKRDQVENLIEKHLAMHAHQERSCADGLEESSEGIPPKPPFYFWIRLLAWFIHQTPFWHAGAKILPERHHQEASEVEAVEMLKGLQGSGFVFVIMESEALARAVGSMGRLMMSDFSSKPIRAMKAPSDPTMIHWYEYGQVPWGLRLLRWVRVPVVLFISCNVWLMFFAGFLHFELMTTGVAGPTVGISGFFVGMLVPIGNALLGLIIDFLVRNSGFQDDDTIQLCRQVLNVAVNAAASIGEIYLVYKKVYNQSDWGILDFMMHVRDKMVPLGVNPSTLDFQHELKVILFPAGMLVPIITIPLLADAMPFVIGRLRLKGDRTLTPADAERILRPNPVDLMPAYTDFIINLFIVTFASWFSPGTYLITLWLTFCLWVLLLYINTRLSVLRWQARSYIGGKLPHKVETFLVAIPLGFLCAALDHEREPADHSGLLGLACHVGGHFIFVNYILATLEPPKQAFGTLFEEMMQSEFAPITNYHNTNPIEVLRRQYCLDELEKNGTPLVFYRNDKWYLQQRFMQSSPTNPGRLRCGNTGELFAGEEAHIGRHGIISAAKGEVTQLVQDIIQVGADTRRGAVQTVQTVRHHGSNRADARTDSRAGSRAGSPVPVVTREKGAADVDRHMHSGRGAPSSTASSSKPVDAS